MEYIVGIILPPFIDYLNKSVYTSEEKTIVTVGVCLLLACVIDWNVISTGTVWDTRHVLVLAGVLVAEAMTVYNLYWKNSDARVMLPGNGIEKQQG